MPTEEDGYLARLQSESRISAHTWRQWCNQLQLDVVEAMDVWDEICLPLMMLSRKAPDVPFVLQAWMARPDLDLITFREELPAALHILAFVTSLQDESLSGTGFKSGILKIFRRVATSPGEVPPPLELRRRRFVVELTSVILIAKVIKGESISLPGVIKVLVEGRGTLDDLVRMAKKAAGTGRVADVVSACLEGRVTALNEAVAADDDEDDDDEWEEDGAAETEANGADAEAANDSEEEAEASGDGEIEAEDDDDEELGDGDELDEDDTFEAPRPTNATEDFLYQAKAAFKLIYAAEANKDKEIPRELLVKRLESVDRFEPLKAYVPTHEEAQAMMRKGEFEQSGGREKTLMKARGGGGARSSGGGKGATSGSPSSGGGGAAPGGIAAAAGAGISMGGGGGGAKKPTVIKGGAATGNATAVTASGFSGYAGEEDEDAEEGLDLVEVSEASLEEAVRQIGALLENVTAADPDVWALFLQPDAELDDVCSLSKRLSQEGTGAQQAAAAIETIGRMQNIKAPRVQPVNATPSLKRSAGETNPNVFRGRWFS